MEHFLFNLEDMLVVQFLRINHKPSPDSRNWGSYRTLICYNHTPGTQDAVTSELFSRNS